METYEPRKTSALVCAAISLPVTQRARHKEELWRGVQPIMLRLRYISSKKGNMSGEVRL